MGLLDEVRSKGSTLGAIVSLAQRWREPTLALLVPLYLCCPHWGARLPRRQDGPWGKRASKTANIPSPANTQVNTFASTSGPWNYVLHPSRSTSGKPTRRRPALRVSVNTTWFVMRKFCARHAADGHADDRLLWSVREQWACSIHGNFSGVPLVAGQQYDACCLQLRGSVAGEVSTVMINGPGCVNAGTNVCTSASIPHPLSGGRTVGLSSLLAMFGLARMRRRSI